MTCLPCDNMLSIILFVIGIKTKLSVSMFLGLFLSQAKYQESTLSALIVSPRATALRSWCVMSAQDVQQLLCQREPPQPGPCPPRPPPSLSLRRTRRRMVPRVGIWEPWPHASLLHIYSRMLLPKCGIAFWYYYMKTDPASSVFQSILLAQYN